MTRCLHTLFGALKTQHIFKKKISNYMTSDLSLLTDLANTPLDIRDLLGKKPQKLSQSKRSTPTRQRINPSRMAASLSRTFCRSAPPKTAQSPTRPLPKKPLKMLLIESLKESAHEIREEEHSSLERDVRDVVFNPNNPPPFNIFPSLLARLTILSLSFRPPDAVLRLLLCPVTLSLIRDMFWLTHSVAYVPSQTAVPPDDDDWASDSDADTMGRPSSHHYMSHRSVDEAPDVALPLPSTRQDDDIGPSGRSTTHSYQAPMTGRSMLSSHHSPLPTPSSSPASSELDYSEDTDGESEGPILPQHLNPTGKDAQQHLRNLVADSYAELAKSLISLRGSDKDAFLELLPFHVASCVVRGFKRSFPSLLPLFSEPFQHCVYENFCYLMSGIVPYPDALAETRASYFMRGEPHAASPIIGEPEQANSRTVDLGLRQIVDSNQQARLMAARSHFAPFMLFPMTGQDMSVSRAVIRSTTLAPRRGSGDPTPPSLRLGMDQEAKRVARNQPLRDTLQSLEDVLELVGHKGSSKRDEQEKERGKLKKRRQHVFFRSGQQLHPLDEIKTPRAPPRPASKGAAGGAAGGGSKKHSTRDDEQFLLSMALSAAKQSAVPDLEMQHRSKKVRTRLARPPSALPAIHLSVTPQALRMAGQVIPITRVTPLMAWHIKATNAGVPADFERLLQLGVDPSVGRSPFMKRMALARSGQPYSPYVGTGDQRQLKLVRRTRADRWDAKITDTANPRAASTGRLSRNDFHDTYKQRQESISQQHIKRKQEIATEFDLLKRQRAAFLDAGQTDRGSRLSTLSRALLTRHIRTKADTLSPQPPARHLVHQLRSNISGQLATSEHQARVRGLERRREQSRLQRMERQAGFLAREVEEAAARLEATKKAEEEEERKRMHRKAIFPLRFSTSSIDMRTPPR